jgi:dTMP kinase
MFITFEGGEGAGKTTQAVRLQDRLRAAGYTTHLTREPGGTPIASEIRAILLHPDATLRALTSAGVCKPDHFAEPNSTDGAEDYAAEPMLPITELLLLSAARAQHVASIREWLKNTDIVICDRFADATRAYQGAGRGLDLGDIAFAERLATEGLKPDLTLLFDLPVEVGLRRKRKHVQSSHVQLGLFEAPLWNRLDEETTQFHQRVRKAYLAMAAEEPERWVVLDATQASNKLADVVWATVAATLERSPA